MVIPMTRQRGHSVLLVPVPALERFIRARWEHYAPELVSRDPAFTHAHVTVLAPYLDEPSADDLAVVGEIVTSTPAFEFRLDDVDAFPDGIVHARPVPTAPFSRLTARLWEAFPQCPPYGGRYDDLVPHVTLDRLSSTVDVTSTRALVGDRLPARCVADRVELHWYETGNCHVRAMWALGVPTLEPDRVSSGRG